MTPITDVEGINSSLLERIAALGIDDAEQLLAIFDIPDLGRNLAASLDLDERGLAALEQSLRDAVPSLVQIPPEALMTLGVFPPELAEEGPPPVDKSPVALPASVNLISQFSKVKDQGHRGTCVAFAVTAIREQLYKKNGKTFDGSEQFLYHRVKQMDGFASACGTWQNKAVGVVQKEGICREVVWKYNTALPCNNNGSQPAAAKADAAKQKATAVTFHTKDVLSAKTTLAAGVAVGLSIPVYNSWYGNSAVYQTGKIGMPLVNENYIGGHAMCAAGYIDNAGDPGGGRFILRNSWGTNWANGSAFKPGYGSIPYAYIAKYGWEVVTLK